MGVFDAALTDLHADGDLSTAASFQRPPAAAQGCRVILSRISQMNDNIVVRIIRICHEYQDVVSVMVVSSWNTQRVNRMMALCGSILTAA